MAAATFALSKLIVHEKVESWVRASRSSRRGRGAPPKGRRLRYAVGELLTCTRCTGAWSALGLVGLRLHSPHDGADGHRRARRLGRQRLPAGRLLVDLCRRPNRPSSRRPRPCRRVRSPAARGLSISRERAEALERRLTRRRRLEQLGGAGQLEAACASRLSDRREHDPAPRCARRPRTRCSSSRSADESMKVTQPQIDDHRVPGRRFDALAHRRARGQVQLAVEDEPGDVTAPAIASSDDEERPAGGCPDGVDAHRGSRSDW